MSKYYFKKKKKRGCLFLALLAAIELIPTIRPCHGLNLKSKMISRPYEWHVAPMQGYTNAPLRYLFRLLSSDAVLWTEMEKLRDLKEADSKALEKRFGAPCENGDESQHLQQPLTLQLGGNNPKDLEDCVASLSKKGYNFREINLNCGCPSIEAGGAADFGASLMKKPDLTQQLIEAIGNGCQRGQASSSSTTISLKCRTGVFETVEEMEAIFETSPGGGTNNCIKRQGASTTLAWREQQFETLCSYISKAQLGGIEHVILHARPAVLAGLSPTKNRLVPPLDYDVVDAVAAEFLDLRVTLNGGISSMHDLDAMIQRERHLPSSSSTSPCHSTDQNAHIDSHMAGRWMLQHPLELAAVQDKYLASRFDTTDNLSSVLDRYMRFVEDSLVRKVHTLSEVCLPLYLIIEELREKFDDIADEGRDRERNALHNSILASEEECYEVLKDVLERLSGFRPSNSKKAKALPEDIHWKKLSSSLKVMVGTKVYNKWKRNRNELS